MTLIMNKIQCLRFRMEAIRKWSTQMTQGRKGVDFGSIFALFDFSKINPERDKSHSIEHFARVEAFIVEIMKDVAIMNKIKDIHKSDFEVRKCTDQRV